MKSPTTSTRTLDLLDTVTSDVSWLVRRYEADWRDATARPLDPLDYLPANPEARRAALADLLRADMGLRWGGGERRPADWYIERHADLDDDGRVALVYEEFCLREEGGESPDPADFRRRFPDLDGRLERVLAIHSLVCDGDGGSLGALGPATHPFPEAGQTTGGFRLVEELGRGSFARVFLAEERQLADRPVALKVSRAGSREPQTLARLQHTHIVPIYSYRTDPATGLHLLCMPYLGRVTLARLLDHLGPRPPRCGAELVAALRQVYGLKDEPGELPAPLRCLAGRSYDCAVAAWGARLAEALQHAHDRGVLHRDIKPSNVLITADGLPMLLDFNLAREPRAGAATGAPGGTLAYMAPEQLEAMADGRALKLDAKADLYAMGLVLFEAFGARAFPSPGGGAGLAEALRRAAADRRAGAPSLRRANPEASRALDAVLRKCLAPDPDDRYATAADLAADLQAVADGGPLRFAPLALPCRAARWARRHRHSLTCGAPVVLALALIGAGLVGAWAAWHRRSREVEGLIEQANTSVEQGHPELAVERYASAARLAHGVPWLRRTKLRAVALAREAAATSRARATADRLLAEGEAVRFGLLGFDGDPRAAFARLEGLLGPFHVLDAASWPGDPDLDRLDEARRARVLGEVNELLFLGVIAALLDDGARPDLLACDRGEAVAASKGPWRALRARLEDDPGTLDLPQDPAAVADGRAAFQWGLLAALDGREDEARRWLERAVQLEPGRYWYHFALADRHARAGHVDAALAHDDVAVALRPDLPWARLNRAHLEWSGKGAWHSAERDLRTALELADTTALKDTIRVELALVLQRTGDLDGARALDRRVVDDGPGRPIARVAALNLARIAVDLGDLDGARAWYRRLLRDVPDDPKARLGQALVALRSVRPDDALDDLDRLLRDRPDDPDLLVARALAGLAAGRNDRALADAEAAERRAPSPARRRLLDRARVAAGRVEDIEISDPAEVADWPAPGPALRRDLRAAVARLGDVAGGPDPAVVLRARRSRAILFAALGDRDSAEAEASRVVALAPLSARAILTRALVRLHGGDLGRARADVDSALHLAPHDPAALALRGRLRLRDGDPERALADLDRAVGSEAAAVAWRARALSASRRDVPALSDWSRALEHDPDDARARLGRAAAFLRLRQYDQALADLEQAVARSGDRPALLAAAARLYALSLIGRPDRLPRAVGIARRAALALLRST